MIGIEVKPRLLGRCAVELRGGKRCPDPAIISLGGEWKSCARHRAALLRAIDETAAETMKPTTRRTRR